jgi:hypothetical protein
MILGSLALTASGGVLGRVDRELAGADRERALALSLGAAQGPDAAAWRELIAAVEKLPAT